MLLLRLACVFSLLASIAAASWWLYATAVRQDWLGLAMGLGLVAGAFVWGTGLVVFDRWLQTVRRA